MRKITVAFIIILLIIGGLGGAFLITFRNSIFFNVGDRYDPTNLNYMDVIYENRSDIIAFNEGYSKSDDCPWGFIHQGIDYFFANNSKVLAAAPGKVIEIKWRDNGEEVDNRFYVSITIMFNRSVTVYYNFEPWTQNPKDKDLQLSMFKVEEGQWVEQGQEIARFLEIGEGAHIHFDVTQNGQKPCPRVYFSTEGYNEILEMIHQYHPDWDLCYP